MSNYISLTRLVVLVLLASCVQDSGPSLNSDNSKCANDINLYTAVNKNILYTDSLNRTYLKVNNITLDNPVIPLSKCQKLPFVFINEVGLADDSISGLEHIIDVKSFVRIKNTDHYYSDKNRVYFYRVSPVTFPRFYEIEINQSDIKVVDSITISDKLKTYRNGILIKDNEIKSK
jgi:hypothetical protein